MGAGNATTALSQMLGDRPVRMTSPVVAVLSLPEVGEWAGPPGSPVVAAYVQVRGDLEGRVALVLEEASALGLLRALLEPAAGRPVRGGLSAGPEPLIERSVQDLEASALMELANIVITSYLNALGEMTGLTLVPSVPSLGADMREAVLSSILAETDGGDPHVLAIRTHITSEAASVEGQLLFLPAEGHLARLLRALGMTGDRAP